MPSPNEPNGNDKPRTDEFQRAEIKPGSTPPNRPRGQPWGIPFALFLLGFALLVALGKLNLSRLVADVLRGVGIGLCVAGFVIARRGQRATR
jgi:hypothetical protein